MITALEKPARRPMRVSELKEGDVAIINFGADSELVYVFCRHTAPYLSMVSLSTKNMYWDNITTNTLPVIHVFQQGERLQIT